MNCPDCLMERSEIVELLRGDGLSLGDWWCLECGYSCVEDGEEVPFSEDPLDVHKKKL